jgi:phosphatidylglycerol:prolipoprotein diacylglycerol transferase
MIAYITINIDPILFHIGSFSLRWYSLIMVAATIVGAFIFAGQLRRKGVEPGHVVGMLVVVVPSAIVGARLFSVLDNYGYYSRHLLDVVKPPYVGLAIYGVLTGGILALVIYCRVKKLPVLRVLDCLALAIPVGQIIGRCANIINGDTWG